MAYRLSVSIRATLVARRLNPSFIYNSHDNDRSIQQEVQPSRSKIDNYLSQTRSFGSYVNPNSAQFTGAFHRTGSCVFGAGAEIGLNRYMSTSTGEAYNLTDIAPVIQSDAPMEAIVTQVVSHAPAVSEVAIAAADSAFPVAALQYLIDSVHTFTGCEWWACIVLTTLLIRGATIPFLISQFKDSFKLMLMRPHLQEIKEKIQAAGMEPQAVADAQKKMTELFERYGVTPFTPIKGLLIQGPVFISFFLAISNMVEKVPSLKTGGAFWFTDLTSPDSMYIFPVVTALTFLASVELNMQGALEGNSDAGTMKNCLRGIAVLAVPLTINVPQAIFCYWFTSNLFSFSYGLVLRMPGVKKALSAQILVPPPSSKNVQSSSFNFFEALKQASVTPKAPATISAPVEESKTLDKKASPTAALSQRLRTLEKQVEQRKRIKKRSEG